MLHVQRGLFRNPIFWVVVGLTLIALYLGLGLAYFSADLGNLFVRQENYRQYVDTANNLEYNLLNAETGQRGFLITQNEAYLKPYTDALPAIQKDLKTLHGYSLSKQYKTQITQITKLIGSKLAELKLTIDTSKSQGQAAAFAIVNTNTGLSDMDTLRQSLATITTMQDKRLQTDITTMEGRVNRLKYFAPTVAILDVILIVAILFLTNRAIKREQELENLKEQFVALASHQLRTPATAVKQYLYLLLSGTFGKLKKEQQSVLEKINDSNERGIKVANNLLNVTAADSGKLTISDNPIDLSSLLQHVLTHYTEALRQSKNQRIVLKLPKKPVLSRVDQFQIRLVFENLIENASKYSNDRTKIYVTLRQTPEQVIFSVKDEGIGIAKKDVPQLFKRFSRLDDAARKTEGSGLGLYLIKKAAELHGGSVKVSSAPGKGSTFTVRIKKVL